MVVDAGFDSTGRGSRGSNAAGPSKAGAGEAKPGDGGGRSSRASELPDPHKVVQDWITLWQSELTAMASDPELRDSWQSALALWSGTMSAVLRGLPRAPSPADHDRTRGQTRPADAPGPASAAAAPDARDAEIERLARHVAGLERRLADIERGGDPPVNPGRRAGRKPRK